jgi:hypothetical protein
MDFAIGQGGHLLWLAVIAIGSFLIDADVGRQLRTKNPNPHSQNHHQWLKKYGQDKVRSQIDKMVTIMKLCENDGMSFAPGSREYSKRRRCK